MKLYVRLFGRTVINGTDGQNHKCTGLTTFSDGGILDADLMLRFKTFNVMIDRMALTVILLCAMALVLLGFVP